MVIQRVLLVLTILTIVMVVSFKNKNAEPSTYKVLGYYSLLNLEKAVNEEFKKGYNCVGGVSVFTDKDGKLAYIQAMEK